MLNLSTELMVYIVSFLPLGERIKLLYVSRKIRSIVSETASLWRIFVWPYYHTSDKGCVNNVLKLCGPHVNLLSFPYHVTPSKLIMMSEYCKNVIQLCLPATKLEPDHLGRILLHMKHLRRLDIQWDTDLKQMLDQLVGTSLTELTIRVWEKDNLPIIHAYFKFHQTFSLFLDNWMLLGFMPQNVNLFTAMTHHFMDLTEWRNLLLAAWYKSQSDFPPGRIGHFKWYINHKVPMNLYPLLLPILQFEFGQGACPPFVHASSCGLPKLKKDLLVLTSCNHDDKELYQATASSMESEQTLQLPSYFSSNIINCVVQLNFHFCDLSSDHLEQIGIALPNLQRLILSSNEDCLRNLQGLRTIADSCPHLKGLNLLGIPDTKVEDIVKLWEILSDMKLTHLSINLSLLVPYKEDNKPKMISLFEKCTSLCAVETTYIYSHGCKNNLELAFLSHLSSLVFYRTDSSFEGERVSLQDLLSSCKKLICLSISTKWVDVQPLTSHCSLQQLSINSGGTALSDNVIDTISAHGGLVHVLLYVSSVTSDGIAVFVRNSPNLITFHVMVRREIYNDTDTDKRIDPKELERRLKQENCQHHLFVQGSCIVKVENYGSRNLNVLDQIFDCQTHTDLISMW